MAGSHCRSRLDISGVEQVWRGPSGQGAWSEAGGGQRDCFMLASFSSFCLHSLYGGRVKFESPLKQMPAGNDQPPSAQVSLRPLITRPLALRTRGLVRFRVANPGPPAFERSQRFSSAL